jgi:hypothetical protein
LETTYWNKGYSIFNVIITTTRVEIVVAPNMNVIRGGVLIGSSKKLGSGLEVIFVGRNLSQSSALPIITITVVGTPQMFFTNSILITHVNKITDQPLMNSMDVGGYRSVDATNKKGGY